MIRSFAYKTGIIIIVTLLIGATGGFSVYRHICHCAGEISASIFMEADCDHANPAAPSSCCAASKSHSCCMDKPSPEKQHVCHDGDCCETSMKFLKINDSFQPGLEKISLKPFAALSSIIITVFKEDIVSAPVDNICSSDLPPPESGKQIILAHHQLKLDPFLV